jgi:hypothetical protein
LLVTEQRERERQAALSTLPMARLGVDRATLLALGLPKSTIDRVYRALYVYSVGFHGVLREIQIRAPKRAPFVDKRRPASGHAPTGAPKRSVTAMTAEGLKRRDAAKAKRKAARAAAGGEGGPEVNPADDDDDADEGALDVDEGVPPDARDESNDGRVRAGVDPAKDITSAVWMLFLHLLEGCEDVQYRLVLSHVKRYYEHEAERLHAIHREDRAVLCETERVLLDVREALAGRVAAVAALQRALKAHQDEAAADAQTARERQFGLLEQLRNAKAERDLSRADVKRLDGLLATSRDECKHQAKQLEALRRSAERWQARRGLPVCSCLSFRPLLFSGRVCRLPFLLAPPE